MASFSFGAGNARKLRRIPLYLAGRLLTSLIPRTRDRWVFGCAVGVTDGALALWREAEAHGERATWLVADAGQSREAERLGIPWVEKDSARGLWATARARVIVVTHGFGDVQRYALTGAFIVQLWHGIPLKRIGLDSAETTRAGSRLTRRALAALYRRTTRQISLLPAASHLVRGRLETAFGLADGRIPVTGEPRVDVLSRGPADERRHAARRALERALERPLDDTRVVLYAPTWRDGAADPAVPDAKEWDALTAALERLSATLLVRSHPLGAGDYTPPVSTERVVALGADRIADVTPLLSGLDLLITDYSSLAFDAALVPLPVLFFAPDLEEYSVRRGLYGTYTDFYVNQNTRNFQMFRYGRRWHVFINHGESDKMYMTTNQFKAYDYAFVAGDAARARLGRVLWDYDLDRRTFSIGRPQADHAVGHPPYPADDRTVVLYAPTWEGDRPSAHYGSVRTHGEALVSALLATGRHRVVYRPHPRSGVVDPEYAAANTRIIAALAAANRADPSAHHVHDTSATLGWQLRSADLAVLDISAMVYDRLAFAAPLLITRPRDPEAEVDESGYLSACEWLDAESSGDIVREADRLLGDPEAGERLRHWVRYYFGDTTPGASSARFHAAVDELMSRWEGWDARAGGGSGEGVSDTG